MILLGLAPWCSTFARAGSERPDPWRGGPALAYAAHAGGAAGAGAAFAGWVLGAAFFFPFFALGGMAPAM